MRKIIITLFLAGTSLYSFAQTQFAVGVKAGPNFAKIDTDAGAQANYESRTGWHAGAFLLVKGEKFGFQPEIVFSQQGSKVTINSEDYESNFNYVNIPIIIKLYTVAGINLQAGPQFGFVNKAETPIRDEATGIYTIEDVKNRMKNTDITAAFGLGWDLPFGLTIDARYNLGLSKMFKEVPPQQTENSKNQVIQVSLGYKLIKLGK